MADTWVSQILAAAHPFQSSPIEQELISLLLKNVQDRNYSANDRRKALAATFDLLVAAEYFRTIAHISWLYCPIDDPMLFYPYTNICLRCVLEGRFVFHRTFA